ncbi:hypothetical protein KC316_g5594, partial [Hortaea werneckii]
MRATFFALAAAGTAFAMDDSSNFMADTAPSGYDNVVTQISDGQIQAPASTEPATAATSEATAATTM